MVSTQNNLTNTMGEASEAIFGQLTKRSSTSDAQDDGLGKRVKYNNPLSGAPAPAPASGGEGENICYGMVSVPFSDAIDLQDSELTSVSTPHLSSSLMTWSN